MRPSQPSADFEIQQIVAWPGQEQQVSGHRLERKVHRRPEQLHASRLAGPRVVDLQQLLTERQFDFAAGLPSRPTRPGRSSRQDLTASQSYSDRPAEKRVPAISTRLPDQQVAPPTGPERTLGQPRIRRRVLPVEGNVRIDPLDRVTA